MAKIPLTIMLDPDDKDALEGIAAVRRCSLAQVVREAVRLYRLQYSIYQSQLPVASNTFPL